jgi:ferredoxin
VLVWIHTRGLIVVGLLAAGNLFCAGCPFIRVRDWGRRLRQPTRHWPAWLRNKWIAVALFASILFSYERFDLWALPRATAYLVIGYFVVAFAIDLVFTGASFCKHVCPIGQFNFAASTLSPLELKIRNAGTCASCKTEDCIAGRRAPAPARPIVQRGCELGLFLPSKVGNLDCTFCLDCVQACPHDNIALAVRTPALELADTRRRSAIGRIVERPDLAALAVVFVFGAMANAFGMVAPMNEVGAWLSTTMGTRSESAVLGLIFVAALVVVPALVIGGATAATRALSASAAPFRQTATRYTFGLLPLGFGVWLAHYGFHFLTGALVVVPVAQTAALDLFGQPLLGAPMWQLTGLRPGLVFPIQAGFIALGTLGSIGVSTLIAKDDAPARPGAAVAPWIVVILSLAAAAFWLLGQPMDMRGVSFAG